jgi:hypothetical protein
MMVNGSPGSSISGDMDVMSDPGDPIHSESILQELFYKNPDIHVHVYTKKIPCNHKSFDETHILLYFL